jgi:PAS domain-containing protein
MQTTTTTMPLPVRSRDEALGSLSLLDFLQKDSRPTFILDVSDVEDPRIAYRNPVLERLLASSGNCTAFDDWALTLRPYTRTSFHHGRAWACSLQRQQAHIIVNSPEALPVKDVDNSHTTMTEPRRYSHASSSWRTNSDDGPNYLDWIQAPSPLMTTHMHLVRNYPWHESSLGPIQTWPDSLRQNVLTAMANPDPRLLLWSDDNIMIYNEACITLFAEKHPHAMGSKAEDTWADVWHEIYPTLKYVKSEGRGTHIKKLPLTMYRSGHLEETYWSFNLVPVVGPQGNTIGVVDEFSEATDVVVSERRREAIVKINRNIANVNSLKELWFEFLEGLEACLEDVPYALLHTIPHADLRSGHDTSSTSSGSTPQRYSYEGSIGLATGHPAVPLSFDLAQGETDQHPLARACYKAWKSGDVVVLQAKDDSLPEIMAVAVPGRGAGDTVRTVCVLPLSDIADNQTMAFLTLALTARRPYDTEAAMLAYYLRDVLIKTASAICLPQEHRRARQKFEQIETSLVQQLRATALETERLENRFAKMSSSAPVGMFAIRPDSRTTFYNQAYLDITGITVDDIESRTDPASHLHEDDRERVMNAWYQCLEDKQGFTSEYRVKKAWNPTDPISGETLHGDTWYVAFLSRLSAWRKLISTRVLSTATPELDEEGNIIHIQGWLLDISDRKYHEKTRIEQIEVEQSETRFARLAASAPLGMYLLTPTGKPLYLNDAYFAILGFTREEFEEAERRGVGWADQIHEDDRARVGEAWLALSQQGIPLNLEYRVKKPWIYLDEATGTQMTGETWVHGTAISEIGIDGTVVAIQGNCTEISLKKFSERLLSERLEDALEHKRQADRFMFVSPPSKSLTQLII